jgi:hypothetical protein
MPITLNTPAKTTISNITYNNIMQDVYNLIQDNKALRDNWTDYISSDAGRMLTEVFAWVAERLAERIDVVGNELFLETAENKESVLRLLKPVGYKLDFPSSAYTVCLSQILNGTNAIEEQITLSYGLGEGGTISLSDSSFKKITHSATSRKFEFIKFDETKKEYDYFSPILTSVSSPQEHVLQEGETKVYSFVVDKLGHNTILLSGPVIKNSVEIYHTNKLDNESWSNKKLLKVDNFFSREAQTSETPVYKTNNLGNGVCEIEFPELDIVRDNYVRLGEEYSIIYRVGGGSVGNIASGSLNFSEQIYLNNGLTRFYSTFRNITEGIGGIDELEADDIKRTAPQDVRNFSAAITEEDYEYILKKNNTSIKDIKAYGEYNITSDEIERAYQYYKNPLDVWLFTIKEKSGFSDTITDITDYINDIAFETFDLNERLNEIYQVNEASINIEVSSISPRATSYVFNDGLTTETIYNPVILDVPEKILSKLEDATILDGYEVVLTEYPFEEKKANIVPNTSNKKYIVNDDDEVGGYPKRYVNTTGELLKESIRATLTSAYSGSTFTTNDGDTITLNIGGIGDISLSFNSSSLSVEDLAQEINNNIQLEYYNTRQAVVLKDNIENITGEAYVSYTIGDTLTFEITSGGIPETFSITLNSAGITWEALKDAMNTALDGASTLTGYQADLATKWPGSIEECFNLIIYNTAEGASLTEFFVDDGATNGLLLAMEEEGPISSGAILNIEETTGSTTIPEMYDFFTYEGTPPNGYFVLSAPEEGEMIEVGNSPMARRLFGLTEDYFLDGSTKISGYKYFVIDAISDTYKMIIGMPSMKDRLPDTIYISGFWGENNTIELGSYYSSLIEDSEIPLKVINLLKRPPIKYLYNTVFNETERGVLDTSSPDIYNSEYELKFTRDKITGYTFEQIGNIEEPPKVTFRYTSSSTLSSLLTNEYIRLRVDSEDLDGITEGYTWTLLEVPGAAEYTEDGYVKINIGLLSSKEIGNIVNAIKSEIFSGKIYSSTINDVPYIYTVTNTYSSALDFTGTPETTFNKVFSEDFKEIFYSTGAIIDVEQIQYKKFSFNRSYFLEDKNVSISGEYNSQTFSSTISTHASMEQFKTAILGDSSLNDKMVFNNDELVFLSKKNGDLITFSIDVPVEEEDALFSFCPDLNGVIPSGITYTFTKENSGDYYIEITDDKYNMIIEQPSAFPYGDIYIHMIEDYRGDHILTLEEDSDITYTDEHVWENSLQGKKMLCVNHVYKQPRFIPFSIDITVRILPNAGNNKQEEYKRNTETLLRNMYNVYSENIGKNIDRNSLALFIERNLSNVSNVSINYLGFDLEGKTNNTETIEVGFNEKAIIASNKTKTVSLEGGITRNVIIQGLNIKVEQSF